MESQYKKWVNLSFLAVSILLGAVTYILFQKLAGVYDFEARIRNIDLVIRLISILVGGILFFILYRHERVNQFMGEVVAELSRVTWPTQRETANATIVVIIMVWIAGMVLGFFDYLWTHILKSIL